MLLLVCALGPSASSAASRSPTGTGLAPFPEVSAVMFTGNTHFSGATLRQVMATKPRALFQLWQQGEPYDPSTLEADLLRLKKFYFDRGFLQTTITAVETHTDAARRRVRVTIALAEGPQTQVAAISLQGALPPELPPAGRLIRLLPLRQHAPLTKAAFDHSHTFLLTRLHNAGYARAQVTPHTDVDPDTHLARVTFTLVPGERTVFGRIAITGASQVQEQAIRRQLRLRQGEVSSDQAITASARAIYDLGMFEAVTPRLLNAEAHGEPLDVDITVTERRPRGLQFALGYSTVEQVRLQGQWTHRNLFGGAQQLTLAGKISALEQKLEARLHLPAVWAPRTSLTHTLFIRNEQEIDTDPFEAAFGVGLNKIVPFKQSQPAFDWLSIGGEIRLSHLWTDTLSGAVGVAVSRNDFRHVNRAALRAAEQEVASDNLLLGQFVEILWDTSDSLFNPTHGMSWRGRIDHANAALLSDVSFVKFVLEFRHYQPLWPRASLATRFKVGALQPYGESDNVPFNVRFFAGGSGSVRGFPANRLGPLNSDRDPIGGQSLIEGNVELRFPLSGDFGAALFVDFGNVFRQRFTYRIEDLRYAIGPGIRYNTLIGPLRLDVGFLVDRRPGEASARVELSIGQAF